MTARQRQVLLLVAAGCTGEQIGRRLNICDRAHAVALAIWRGDISLAELAAIAGGPSVRAIEEARAGAEGPQDAQKAAGGARDVRDATEAAEGRAGGFEEAAA
jgi:hypothetical protein